jgi:signal peptidase I
VVFYAPRGAQEAESCGDPNQGDGHLQACATATPDKSSVKFVKRIVAGPGDTVSIVDGHVIRNGKPASEPFIIECGGGGGCSFPKPITIPAGHWYLIGDNRGESDDSRFFGPIADGWIIGRKVGPTY